MTKTSVGSLLKLIGDMPNEFDDPVNPMPRLLKRIRAEQAKKKPKRKKGK